MLLYAAPWQLYGTSMICCHSLPAGLTAIKAPAAAQPWAQHHATKVKQGCSWDCLITRDATHRAAQIFQKAQSARGFGQAYHGVLHADVCVGCRKVAQKRQAPQAWGC
jgi:hypothetical protein